MIKAKDAGGPSPIQYSHGNLLEDKVRQALADLTAQQNLKASDFAASYDGNPSQTPIDEGLPFEQVAIDLTGVDANLGATTTTPVILNRPGKSLYFRLRDSAPGARLIIKSGGTYTPLMPGQRLRSPFSRIEILLDAYSAVDGIASLVIEKSDLYKFEELPLNIPSGAPFQAFDLVGTFSSQTFVSIPRNTQPSGGAGGASGLASIPTAGVRQAQLFFDTNIDAQAGTVGSFDLEPWFFDPLNKQWWAQSDQTFTVPDSNVTGTRWHMYVLNLNAANGLLYLNPIYSGAGISTHIGLIARAIA